MPIATIEEQIESKMIEDAAGKYCVCLDKESSFNMWLFFRHPDGIWVTKRLALPIEIQMAQKKLECLRELAGVPCKG